MSPRTITRNSTERPVTQYRMAIPGRAESLPASSPWRSAIAKAGTARRWIVRHRAGRRSFRVHDVARTITVANIAAIPSASAKGR